MTAFIEHRWIQKAKVKFRRPQNYSVFQLEDLINEPFFFRILCESLMFFMIYGAFVFPFKYKRSMQRRRVLTQCVDYLKQKSHHEPDLLYKLAPVASLILYITYGLTLYYILGNDSSVNQEISDRSPSLMGM